MAKGAKRAPARSAETWTPSIGAAVIVPFGVGSARGRVTDVRNGRVYVDIKVSGASGHLSSSFEPAEVEAQIA